MALFETNLSSLALCYRGKVRDLYTIDDTSLLMIATDRLSAFDQVFPKPIHGKGKILTSMSLFWFEKTKHIIRNHILSDRIDGIVTPIEANTIQGQAVIVKKLKPIPIESIVRGHLSGSSWKDYQQTQSVSGVDLPTGLTKNAKLPHPIWTPSFKISDGGHDITISHKDTAEIIGRDLSEEIKTKTIDLYTFAYNYLQTKNITLVDMKVEFGLDDQKNLYLMDELLTPDSSRYWMDKEGYSTENPYWLDKQYIRDYCSGITSSDKKYLHDISDDIFSNLYDRYYQAYEAIVLKK